jgi:hypothetical protein
MESKPKQLVRFMEVSVPPRFVPIPQEWLDEDGGVKKRRLNAEERVQGLKDIIRFMKDWQRDNGPDPTDAIRSTMKRRSGSTRML